MKRINKCIRVTAFTMEGKRIKSFKAIDHFLDYAKRGKLGSSELKSIRNGKVILVSRYLLTSNKRFRYWSTINPFKCKLLLIKDRNVKNGNLLRLRKFYDNYQLIAIIDNNLKLLGYTTKTIKEISKQHKVSVGTIKASLHRSAKRFKNSSRHTIHYVHLKDLPAFIDNAQKSIK